MGDNKVVKSLWIGGALTNLERMCINSFIKNGHEFHLYIYDNVEGIPLGATIKDGNDIIDEKEIFTYTDPEHNGSYSAFSNWFRYKMLYELGGYWVDMDMVCLKPFDFEGDYLFSSEKVYGNHPELVDGVHLNAGVIKVPKHSELMKYCWDKTQEIGKNIVWGQIGPKLLRSAVYKFNLQNHLQLPNVFCPIHYGETKTLVEQSWSNDYGKQIAWQRPFDLENECYGLHLWNECWRTNGLDKNGSYPKDTLYEKLKEKYSG